jgi:hypothetical protein
MDFANGKLNSGTVIEGMAAFEASPSVSSGSAAEPGGMVPGLRARVPHNILRLSFSN